MEKLKIFLQKIKNKVRKNNENPDNNMQPKESAIKEFLNDKEQARQKKLMKLFYIFIAFVVVIIALVVVIIVMSVSNSNHKKGNVPKEVAMFDGKYAIDEYTKYEFDGAGKGALCLGDTTRYVFEYFADNNVVSLDFEDPEISDVIYQYSFDGDNISLHRENSKEFYILENENKK